MRTLAIVPAIAAASALFGCVEMRPFHCTEDPQCVDGNARGACLYNYCAYYDKSCEGPGWRFEAHAGDGLGGECYVADEETPITCEAYCEVFLGTASCHELAYPSGPDGSGPCLAACDRWPEIGEETDSRECRYFAAKFVQQSEDPVKCDAATPSGEGGCQAAGQASCVDYCTAYLAACPSVELELEACRHECLAIYPGVPGGDTTGNTIECRLAVLGMLELEDRCTQAGITTTTMCVDP